MRYAAGCRPHSLTLSGHRALCCAPRHVTLAFPELAPRVDTRSALLDEHLAAEAARELGPGQLPSPGGQRGPRGPVSAQRAGVQERAAHACPGVSWGHGTEHRREAAQPSESAKRGRRGGSRGGAGRGRGLWREEPLEEEPQERVGEEARAGAAAETGAVRGGTQLPSTRSPHRQGVPLELSRYQPVDGHGCRPARPCRAVDRQRACSPRAAAHSDLSALLAQSGLQRELKL